MSVAPRLPARLWNGRARGALMALCLWPGGAAALEITQARYSGPTTFYGHLVLGIDHNWSRLDVTLSDGTTRQVTLTDRVFEDTAPRVVDMDGDGSPEILTVESMPGQGARVAFYGFDDGSGLTLRAATPYIGTGNRWLAPVGAADLDGDGVMEFAYIDRPHLARILRVLRYVPTQGGADLVPVAAAQGLTNHRIGEAFISGGIRDCGDGPQIVTADAGWTRVVITTLAPDGTLTARAAAPFSPSALADVMACTR